MGVNRDKMSRERLFSLFIDRGKNVSLTADDVDGKVLDQFNEDMADWAVQTWGAIRLNLAQMVTDKRYKLYNSIRYSVTHYRRPVDRYHPVSSIGFGFKDYGVYLHIGVGRGYNRENGTVVVTKKNKDKSFKRFPKPWFDPVVEERLPDLEQIVTDLCEGLFINTSKLLINR